LRPAATVLAGYASLSDSRRVRAARFIMAAAQSAVALVLLSGSVLLGRSYVNLVSQDTGFAANVRIASVSYPSGHVGAPLQADVNATLERLRRIRGVTDVAAATGSLVGTVAGRWLSSLLEHLSYGVKAGDWTSVAAAAALTMTIVAVASAIPAARAVKLMPSIALRVE
jgi:hypothetical protein